MDHVLDSKRDVGEVLGVPEAIEQALSNRKNAFWEMLDQSLVDKTKIMAQNIANNLFESVNQLLTGREDLLKTEINDAFRFLAEQISSIDLEHGAFAKSILDKGIITKEELNSNYEVLKAKAVEIARKVAENQKKKNDQEIENLKSLPSRLQSSNQPDKTLPDLEVYTPGELRPPTDS